MIKRVNRDACAYYDNIIKHAKFVRGMFIWNRVLATKTFNKWIITFSSI